MFVYFECFWNFDFVHSEFNVSKHWGHRYHCFCHIYLQTSAQNTGNDHNMPPLTVLRVSPTYCYSIGISTHSENVSNVYSCNQPNQHTREHHLSMFLRNAMKLFRYRSIGEVAGPTHLRNILKMFPSGLLTYLTLIIHAPRLSPDLIILRHIRTLTPLLMYCLRNLSNLVFHNVGTMTQKFTMY